MVLLHGLWVSKSAWLRSSAQMPRSNKGEALSGPADAELETQLMLPEMKVGISLWVLQLKSIGVSFPGPDSLPAHQWTAFCDVYAKEKMFTSRIDPWLGLVPSLP